MSTSNLSALKRFVKGNTTAKTGTSTVSLVFDTVTTATTATTASIPVATTAGDALKYPPDGFVEVLVEGTLVKIPYFKA